MTSQKQIVSPQRFAVFDIDGTLFRWQLFYSVVFELRNRGAFPEEVANEIDKKYRQWKGRETSWQDFSEPVVHAFLDNLKDLKYEQYLSACQAVVDNEGHKVYAYTLQLLKKLKKEGYTLVAITGSQHEIAEIFTKKYGFDVCYGEKYLVENGKFSGDVDVVYNQKDVILRQFLSDYPVHSLAGSVGVGDSRWDVKMLELVETPIAFNPDPELFERAKKDGWTVVIERKNIAYKLEKKGDDIVLAETIIY
ncbi:MAG: HAD family hydrolase [Acidobacteriota bacterium]